MADHCPNLKEGDPVFGCYRSESGSLQGLILHTIYVDGVMQPIGFRDEGFSYYTDVSGNEIQGINTANFSLGTDCFTVASEGVRIVLCETVFDPDTQEPMEVQFIRSFSYTYENGIYVPSITNTNIETGEEYIVENEENVGQCGGDPVALPDEFCCTADTALLQNIYDQLRNEGLTPVQSCDTYFDAGAGEDVSVPVLVIFQWQDGVLTQTGVVDYDLNPYTLQGTLGACPDGTVIPELPTDCACEEASAQAVTDKLDSLAQKCHAVTGLATTPDGTYTYHDSLWFESSSGAIMDATMSAELDAGTDDTTRVLCPPLGCCAPVTGVI